MKGFFPVFWFVLAVSSGTALFHTSQDVQDTLDETARLASATAEERESLRVLKAEWAYLNQPERLERLAAEHLDLAPMTGSQLAGLDRVPEKGPARALVSGTPAPATATGTQPASLKNAAPIQPATTAATPAAPRGIPPKASPASQRSFDSLIKSLGGQ